MGILGGALVGGGAALAAAKIGTSWAVVGSMAGGAASGAGSAAAFGGDIGMSAAIGAIGAGLGGIGSGIGGTIGAIAGGAVAGGIAAELLGGKFGQGAAMGATYATLSALMSYGMSKFRKKAPVSKDPTKQAAATSPEDIQGATDTGYAEAGPSGAIKGAAEAARQNSNANIRDITLKITKPSILNEPGIQLDFTLEIAAFSLISGAAAVKAGASLTISWIKGSVAGAYITQKIIPPLTAAIVRLVTQTLPEPRIVWPKVREVITRMIK